jgi:hypothetical protein
MILDADRCPVGNGNGVLLVSYAILHNESGRQNAGMCAPLLWFWVLVGRCSVLGS